MSIYPRFGKSDIFLKTMCDIELNEILESDELNRLVKNKYFFQTTTYDKLFDYYSEEMPYGVAKYRTGEADMWILNKLAKRFSESNGY